ncbi:hypothetical protein [Streptomyces sp. NPDC048638]|uniref:terpene synthase family protein n=1 Tax=Streptomyces sp. NPDC048638 TaxID=3365580 RepID=UPI00371DB2A6
MTDADAAHPAFTIPWPARLNPHVEQMRRRSLRWAQDAGIVCGEEEVRRLDGPRFDRLAGYAHPDAQGPGAQLVSDWMFWFFPFDDWFDGPVGEDPALVRGVIDPMVRFGYGDAGALPLSAPPLVHAFAELCGRSRMGMTSGWQSRFAEDMATYLFSYVLEAQMRQRPGEGSLEHVVEVRRNAIGIRPSLTFGETAEGRELGFPLALSETLHRLRRVCADTVVVQNDAYSLHKDLHQGESSNQAVLLMREQGMAEPEAIRHLEGVHDRLIDEYLDLEGQALPLPRRYALPEQTAHLTGYLSNLRSWISGNNAWSQETRRYSDHHTT